MNDSFIKYVADDFQEYLNEKISEYFDKDSEYIKLKNKRDKLLDDYPKVREFLENLNKPNLNNKEKQIIEEIFLLDGKMNDCISELAYKLGIKETILFFCDMNMLDKQSTNKIIENIMKNE